MKCNFSNSLWIFPAVTNYRRLEAVVLIFPYTIEVKQIHTYKGPSDKSLFLHKVPSGISTPHSPPLIHQDTIKNISSVIIMVIFTYNRMFCFSILVSAGSQQCSLV